MNLKRKENLSGVIAIATLLVFLFIGVVDIFGPRSGMQCLLTFGFFWSGFFALLTILSLLIPIIGMNIPAIQQTTKNNLEIKIHLSDCELSVFSAEPINEIEIFSSNGCLIQRNQGENLQTTNVPQLPAGIYLVKVKSEEGYTVTKKILKR